LIPATGKIRLAIADGGALGFDKNSNGKDSWDGTFKNESQPVGTYLYYITVVSASGVISNKEGSFVLLR